MSLTFGSLFAGIGGFDLGFERAGMECRWQVEIDDYCRQVLAKHWPDVRRYADVREVGKHNLEPVDVICGGFPCQPYSVAGKQKGEEDYRNLWPEFLRVIKELRPAWVVGENVPGIIRMYLDTVLFDLESEDYSCWTFNIPAMAFNAPHRRERIFIVAHATSQRWNSRRNSGKESDYQGQYAQENRQSGGRQRLGFVQSRENMANTKRKGLEIRKSRLQQGEISTTELRCIPDGWWTTEPNVGRVANGIPARVDRLRALGNAVVPQVAEWIGKRIVEIKGE